MTKFFLIIFLLLFSCNKNNIDWSLETFEETFKSNNHKNVLVYFYADW